MTKKYLKKGYYQLLNFLFVSKKIKLIKNKKLNLAFLEVVYTLLPATCVSAQVVLLGVYE